MLGSCRTHHLCDGRSGILQDLKPFAFEIGAGHRQAGDVSAWLGEIGDEAVADGIVEDCENNRRLGSGCHDGANRLRAGSNNDVEIALRQIAG